MRSGRVVQHSAATWTEPLRGYRGSSIPRGNELDAVVFRRPLGSTPESHHCLPSTSWRAARDKKPIMCR